MKISNIQLGENVQVDPTSSINNVNLGANVKIAKFCSVFGSPENLLIIGEGSYVGMFSIINGFADQVTIGKYVSIAQNVNIMADSGPNASSLMQKLYPIKKGAVVIGDHVWLGAGVIISPGVTIGSYSVIAANSFVNEDVQPESLYAGNPAKFVKKLDIPKQ